MKGSKKDPQRNTLGRRRFLKGMLAGGAMVTLPLPRLGLDLDNHGTAWADGSTLPSRFGMWFFGNGIDPARWHPEGRGGEGNAWQLTEQLAPLSAYKRYLTVLSGYENKMGEAHVGGSAGATTGAPPDELGSARLPSIDQVIADLIGRQTPFRSIEVGLSKATPAGPQPTLHAISHRGKAAPNYPEYDPHRLFGRLFGVASASPALRGARRSVLDTVMSDLKALEGKVGADDKARLQAHAEGIRALELRLSSAPMSCGELTAPGPEIQADTKEEAPWVLNEAMSQMMALALACDLTHVFSYVFTLPAGHVYYRHLGEEFNRSYHEDIVHLVDALPNGYGMVRQGVVYTMECFARTLQAMAETPTATGGSLLDEMCILATSEVSYGWTHEMHDAPVLLAGKASGRLKGDVHLVGSDDGRRNYSEVLMALANMYGANVQSFGAGPGQVSREATLT
ncbi:MAG: DUF1552 domain-containing protein [Bradymonadia bacterium]